MPPVFRFAPTPNGALHLGHAYSALLNFELARRSGGRFLLRLEDIDPVRWRRATEQAILDDLEWLGTRWEEPVRRQRQHFDDYAAALDRLKDMGLIYPSFVSRADLARRVAGAEAAGHQWPRDPNGAPLPPPEERDIPETEAAARIAAGETYALRLRMDRSVALAGPLAWIELGSSPDGRTGRMAAQPAAWGDVVIARKETPTSYHLSVTVDDALQGITHVVRGKDLFAATAVHRLLQQLLGLPEPLYLHHRLILDGSGRKLPKSNRDIGLADLRRHGVTPADIRRMTGLDRDLAAIRLSA